MTDGENASQFEQKCIAAGMCPACGFKFGSPISTAFAGEGKRQMKSWHLGIVIAIIAGYIIGAMYPGVFTTLKSKIGA